MALFSSPFISSRNSVSTIMFKVLLALVPAIAAYYYYFGPAILISILLASATALLSEAAMLRIRNYPIQPFLMDGSALVTAWLLALSMPPLSPWWLIVTATAFAIIVAKQLYGGLGNNLFNPAMIGYAVMLISFPVQMTHWPALQSMAQVHFGMHEMLGYILGGQLPDGIQLDAITSATPLDTMKTQLMLGHTVSEISKMPVYGYIGGQGGEIIALLYLLGGLYLWQQRIITWHIPFAMLGGIFVTATLFHVYDPDRYVSPWFHLATGGAMLGAFFIATDPITGATTPKGKLIFGAGIGALTYLIRNFGGYPDGIAFAVLIMNICVPLIDAYTQPRVFGHPKEKQRQKGDGHG